MGLGFGPDCRLARRPTRCTRRSPLQPERCGLGCWSDSLLNGAAMGATACARRERESPDANGHGNRSLWREAVPASPAALSPDPFDGGRSHLHGQQMPEGVHSGCRLRWRRMRPGRTHTGSAHVVPGQNRWRSPECGGLAEVGPEGRALARLPTRSAGPVPASATWTCTGVGKGQRRSEDHPDHRLDRTPLRRPRDLRATVGARSRATRARGRPHNHQRRRRRRDNCRPDPKHSRSGIHDGRV